MVRTTTVELTVLGAAGLRDADLEELGVRRARPCTFLEATVRDQAALYGLLQRLAALGLELVTLRTAPAGASSDVEIVVRGSVGGLVRSMLEEVTRAVPARSATLRVRDGSLAGTGAGHPGTDEAAGQVRYLVAELPERRLDGDALLILRDAVRTGVPRVLDLAVVVPDGDGDAAQVPLGDLRLPDGFDASVLDDVATGLIDVDHLRAAAAEIAPASAAVVLVYEATWEGTFVAALRRDGGTILAHQAFPPGR